MLTQQTPTAVGQDRSKGCQTQEPSLLESQDAAEKGILEGWIQPPQDKTKGGLKPIKRMWTSDLTSEEVLREVRGK